MPIDVDYDGDSDSCLICLPILCIIGLCCCCSSCCVNDQNINPPQQQPQISGYVTGYAPPPPGVPGYGGYGGGGYPVNNFVPPGGYPAGSYPSQSNYQTSSVPYVPQTGYNYQPPNLPLFQQEVTHNYSQPPSYQPQYPQQQNFDQKLPDSGVVSHIH